MPPVIQTPGLPSIFTTRDSSFPQEAEACDETSLDDILVPEGSKKVYTCHDPLPPNTNGEAVVPASRPTIFLFNREGHTLGNLLTTELRKNPSVDYAGYKVSHPHDHSFELRIHMAPRRKEGYEAKDAVTDACKDLMADLGILSKRITAECYIYQAATQGRINTGDCDDKTPYSAAHHPGRHFAAGDFDAATQRPSTPPAGSIFGQLSNEWDFMSFLATSEDVAQADPPTVGSMIPGVFPGAGGEGGGMGGNNLGPPRA